MIAAAQQINSSKTAYAHWIEYKRRSCEIKIDAQKQEIEKRQTLQAELDQLATKQLQDTKDHYNEIIANLEETVAVQKEQIAILKAQLAAAEASQTILESDNTCLASEYNVEPIYADPIEVMASVKAVDVLEPAEPLDPPKLTRQTGASKTTKPKKKTSSLKKKKTAADARKTTVDARKTRTAKKPLWT